MTNESHPPVHAFVVVGKRYGECVRKILIKLGPKEEVLHYVKLCEHQVVGSIMMTSFRYNFTADSFQGSIDVYNITFLKPLPFFSRKKESLNFSGIMIPTDVVAGLRSANSISAFDRKVANQKCSKYKVQLLQSFLESYNSMKQEESSNALAIIAQFVFLRTLKIKTGFEVYDYEKRKTAEEVQREKRKKYGFAK